MDGKLRDVQMDGKLRDAQMDGKLGEVQMHSKREAMHKARGVANSKKREMNCRSC